MSHKHYTNIEDFLIDNTFQEYCSGENIQCIQYWENYRKAHPEQEETIASAIRLFRILAGHKKPLQQQLESLKQSIQQSPRTEQYKSISYWKTFSKIAAALVLCGIGYWWYTSSSINPDSKVIMTSVVKSYRTGKGEKKTFSLNDGTLVTLNADSKLDIGKQFDEEYRQVHLEGEAYFQVKKDKNKPFILHTNEFDIRVLGTSFNVKSYPNEMSAEALLVEGLIELKSKGKNENSIIIKPNQKVTIYKQEKVIPSQIDARKSAPAIPTLKEIAIQNIQEQNISQIADIAWKENRLTLVDQDFHQLKNTLERWYNVEISLEGEQFLDYRFTATFDKENIEQVLIALQKVKPFNYKTYGNKITIYKK